MIKLGDIIVLTIIDPKEIEHRWGGSGGLFEKIVCHVSHDAMFLASSGEYSWRF